MSKDNLVFFSADFGDEYFENDGLSGLARDVIKYRTENDYGEPCYRKLEVLRHKIGTGTEKELSGKRLDVFVKSLESQLTGRHRCNAAPPQEVNMTMQRQKDIERVLMQSVIERMIDTGVSPELATEASAILTMAEKTDIVEHELICQNREAIGLGATVN